LLAGIIRNPPLMQHPEQGSPMIPSLLKVLRYFT
jgi:hypothetical protein